MCVRAIIDTNMFGELFSDQVRPLRKWIERKDGILVYPDGGQYNEELNRSRKILELFRTYRQNGFARLIRQGRVEVEDEHVDIHTLRSDDLHIVTLARASNALVLCTNDEHLKEDFKNRDLLPHVGGEARAVYPLNAQPTDQRDFVDRRKCARRRHT